MSQVRRLRPRCEETLKLSVSLVSKGRYHKAFEEIPPDVEIPPHVAVFAVSEPDDAPDLPSPAHHKPQTPAKRPRRWGAQ